MINYIVYGNTDYLDVLQIQTDYMVGRGHLTLFINNNTLDISDLYSKYDKVVYYNSEDQYPKRLLTCLESVESEYFLFIHDIDILIDVDTAIIEKFYSFLSSNNFDRVDLKYTEKVGENTLIFKVDENEITSVIKTEMVNGVYLVKQNEPSDYIYNVNPSIWKKDSFVKLLDAFKSKNYRTIEEMDVQNFAKQFKVFKIYSDIKLECGYFICVPLFKFLHISHSGKLLPLNQTFTTPYGQSYKDVSDEYGKIVDKYNLTKSSKWIR